MFCRKWEQKSQLDSLVEEEVVIVMEIAQVIERSRKDRLEVLKMCQRRNC